MAVSTCLSPLCRTEAEGEIAACPACGKRMRTPSQVRRTGWVLVFLGVFLAIFIGWIALALAPALQQPGVQAGDGNTFTGTAAQARIIFILFGMVVLFGFACVVNGLVQIRTGMRNRVASLVTLGLAAGLVVYALFATSALG